MMNLIAIFSLLMQACGGKELSQNDIIGKWESVEKSELVFNQDGTFTGKSIPVKFGFMPSDSLTSDKFSGSGKWLLKEASPNWEVELDFDKVTVNKNGCSFPILIAGENGILDNKPPWYLFLWKEEEGGERYKFVKKE